MHPSVYRFLTRPFVREGRHRLEQGNLGFTTSGPVSASGAASGGIGAPVQLLQFPGEEEDPRVATVSLAALITDPNAGAVGPLVGIASWASGLGARQEAEFDIPLAPNSVANALFPRANVGTQGSGVLVSLPLSGLTVSVRNDAAFVPNAGGNALGGNFLGCKVTASLGVGTKASTGRLFRTVWSMNGGAGLAAASNVGIGIPPFANRVTVLRFDAAETIQVRFEGLTGSLSGPYNVAANAIAPTFDLPPGCIGLTVFNTGGAAILTLAALFELGL